MSTAEKARETYEKSVAELNRVLASLSATPAQKRSAQAALNAMSAQYGADVIATVAGRTQLLNKLVAELRQVIQAVQVNPFSDVVDTLNGLVGSAQQVLAEDAG